MTISEFIGLFNLKKKLEEHPGVAYPFLLLGILMCGGFSWVLWNTSEQREISALERELSTVEEERDIAQRSNNSLRKEVENLEVERDNFSGNLNSLEERARDLANQVSELRTQVAEAESRTQELQGKNEELQVEVNQLNSENSASQAQVDRVSLKNECFARLDEQKQQYANSTPMAWINTPNSGPRPETAQQRDLRELIGRTEAQCSELERDLFN